MGSVTDADLENRPSKATKTNELKGTHLTEQEMAAKYGVGVACTKGYKPESPNQDSYVCIRSASYLNGQKVFTRPASLSRNEQRFPLLYPQDASGK